MQCPICEKELTASGYANLKGANATYRTNIYFCRSCNLFCREMNNQLSEEHFNIAGYTQWQYEQIFYNRRINFFRWIFAQLDSYLNHTQTPVLIDIGSSYGHFLKIAEEHGVRSIGIEINNENARVCKERGQEIQATIEEIDCKGEAHPHTGATVLQCKTI